MCLLEGQGGLTQRDNWLYVFYEIVVVLLLKRNGY